MVKKVLFFISILFLLVSCGLKEVNITFNSNGGSTVSSITSENDFDVNSLPITSKEGHTFQGWYLDQSLNTKLSLENVPERLVFTLYAKWSINDYTISFNSNGGSDITSITAPYNSSITEPELPLKDGAVFDGWYKNSELTELFTFNKMPYQNLTLYAKWLNEKVYYIETYFENANDDNYTLVETNSFIALVGNNVNATINEYPNFTFDSAYIGNKLSGIISENDALTLKVYYKRNLTSLTFNSNEGELVESLSLKHGSTLSLPIPIKTGHSFLGWYIDDNFTTPFTENTVPIDGITLIAKWQINQYTISFVSNAEITVTSITSNYNDVISAPSSPIRQGYTFVGWFTDSDLLIPFIFNRMPAENITLYAKWQPGNETMTFVTNGGDAIAPITTFVDSDVTKPIPVYDGFIFVDWYTDISLTKVFSSWKMPVGGITLYAKWEPIDYTLVFDSCGGSTVDSITLPYTSVIPMPNNPTRTGYIFDGWYIDIDCTTPFDFYMPLNGAIVYAKWYEVDAINIDFLINSEPGFLVEFMAIVYAQHSYGFYVFDDTGEIFVLTNQVVNLGDKVKIKGTVDFWNNSPRICAVEDIVVISEDNTLKNINQMAMEELVFLSSYGLQFETFGVITEEEGIYYLNNFSGNDKLLILPYFLDENSYLDLVNMVVKVTIIFINYEDEWQVGIQAIDLMVDKNTDEYRNQLVCNQLMFEFNNKSYYPYELFIAPFVPFNWGSVSYQVIGPNQELFDGEKFLPSTEEKTIQFEFKVVVGNINTTLEVNVNLIPFSIVSIADFLLGDDNQFYTIHAKVILFASDMRFALLQDNTGNLYIQNDNLKIGDEVIVTIFKEDFEDYLIVLDNQLVINKILSHENHLEEPTPVNDEEIDLLNPNDVSIYGNYIELRGFLRYVDSDFQSTYYLETKYKDIFISSITWQAFEQLDSYLNVEVIIAGYIGPNRYTQEEDNDWMLFFSGYRDEAKIPTYTDQELVNTLSKIYTYHFQHISFKANDHFDVPPFDLLLGGSITWELSPSSAPWYDSNKKRFELVEEEKNLEFNFVFKKNDVELHVAFNKVLKPLEYVKISELNTINNNELIYVKGLVVYRNFNFLYLQDDTGIVLVYAYDEPVFSGDYVVLKVEKRAEEYFSNRIYLTGNYYGQDNDESVVKVISRSNNVELIPEPSTVEEVQALNAYDYKNYFHYLEITGQLLKEGYDIYLFDGMQKVLINCADNYIEAQLNPYLYQEITIKAYINKYQNSNGCWVLMFTGLQNEIDYFDISFTMDLIKDRINTYYQNQVYNENQNVLFIKEYQHLSAFITYTPFGDNANVVEPSNDKIGEVSEDLSVNINVVIQVGNQAESFDITIYILDVLNEEVPKEEQLVSISTFKQSNGERLMIQGQLVTYSYYLSVVLIEDDTGSIYVNLDYIPYDIRIGRIYQVSGQLNNYHGRLEMIVASEIKLIENSNISYEFDALTFSDIVFFDHYDNEVFGRPVKLTGTLIKENDYNIPIYYLTNGIEKVRIIDNSYSLNQYIDLEITIQGFIYSLSNYNWYDCWNIIVNDATYNEYKNAIVKEYLNTEKLDYVKDIINYFFTNLIISPFDEIYVPDYSSSWPLFPNVTVIYDIVNGSEVLSLNDDLLQAEFVENDTTVTLKITLMIDEETEEFFCTVTVKKTTINSLIDLLAICEGTPLITLMGIVYYVYMNDIYFLINGEIYYLANQYLPFIRIGSEVIISGQKNVRNHEGDFGYDITITTLDSYQEIDLEPYPITIAQIYENDFSTDDIRRKLLQVYGKLYFDEFLSLYYLEHEGQRIYLRIVQYMPTMLGVNNFEILDLFLLDSYLYENVYLNLLFPNIYICGDIYLLDLDMNRINIILPDYTALEELELVGQKLIDSLSYSHFSSFQSFDLPTGDYHHNVEINWEFQNEDDANYLDFKGYYWGVKWLTERKEINLVGTIKIYDEEVFKTIVLPIIFEPAPLTPIIDVLRGKNGSFYFIKGIVTAVSSNKNYIVIKDETGVIFCSEHNLVYEVGDEVIVSGYLRYEEPLIVLYGVNSQLFSKNNQVNLEPIEMTIEEIKALDYYHPNTWGLYVKVKATVVQRGSSYYPYFTVETTGIDKGLELLYPPAYSSDKHQILKSLVGKEIEFTGFILGPISIWGDSRWYITFDNYNVLSN